MEGCPMVEGYNCKLSSRRVPNGGRIQWKTCINRSKMRKRVVMKKGAQYLVAQLQELYFCMHTHTVPQCTERWLDSFTLVKRLHCYVRCTKTLNSVFWVMCYENLLLYKRLELSKMANQLSRSTKPLLFPRYAPTILNFGSLCGTLFRSSPFCYDNHYFGHITNWEHLGAFQLSED